MRIDSSEVRLDADFKGNLSTYIENKAVLQTIVSVAKTMVESQSLAIHSRTKEAGADKSLLKLIKQLYELRALQKKHSGARFEVFSISMDKFVSAAVPAEQVKSMAVQKVASWKKATLDILLNIKKHDMSSLDQRILKMAYADMFPAISSMKTMSLEAMQIQPFLEDPGHISDGQLVLSGCAGQCTLMLLHTLKTGSMTKAKINKALADPCIKEASLAWASIDDHHRNDAVGFRMRCCPDAEPDTFEHAMNFFTLLLTEFNDACEKMKSFLMDLAKPLLEEMRPAVVSVEGKTGAEFLATFTTADLKKVTPLYHKHKEFVVLMKSVFDTFGILKDEHEQHKGVSIKVRCLSVRWGLYTIFKRREDE